jgi:hypothetical protein
VIYKSLGAGITSGNSKQIFNIPMRHEISKNSSYYARQRRLDLALIQTCRQLRAEYSAIYAKHTVISITLSRLIEYINAVEPDELPVFPSGNITVHSEAVRRFLYEATEIDWYEDSAIDIMPLIRLYKRHPNLPLTMYIGLAASNALSVIGRPGYNEVWFETFGKNIETVLAYPRCAFANAKVVVVIA